VVRRAAAVDQHDLDGKAGDGLHRRRPAVALPYVDSGSYTGFTTVFVLRDPMGSGSGQLVLGSVRHTGFAPAAPPVQPPPATPSTKQVKVTIRPSDSGTWSNKWSRFYAWNVGRYGGSTTLYQGDAFGSGVLEGIAVYGNQIKALNALSIDAAVLHVPLATGSGTVQVQGTSQGTLSGNPTPSGATASGTGSFELGATLRGQLRTGTTKGLVLVGASYLAVYGTSKASGMSLSITYTRAA
jgi:hypothetical protein